MVIDTAVRDLVNRRRRADIRQVDLAAEMGIGRRSLLDFENGKTAVLARSRTVVDYLAAIEAIKARRTAQGAGSGAGTSTLPSAPTV